MAKVHFFCEASKLIDQNSLQVPGIKEEFGPRGTDIFNVTSRHKISSTANVYAMFSGSVVYQYDGNDSAFLNVILKVKDPTIFNGIPVKYIIYRGIDKDSLLEPTTGTNAFENLTSQSGNHVNAKVNPVDGAPKKYYHLGLGIQNTNPPPTNHQYLASNEDLDLIFNTSLGAKVEVAAGDILGQCSDIIGVEVILENFWNKPKVEILRDTVTLKDTTSPAVEGGHKIDVSSISGTAEIKAEREKILNYMDVCALLGCLSNPTIAPIDEANLQSHIFNKFENKNKVYISIKNENNLSLDFYEEYGSVVGGNYTNYLKFEDSGEAIHKTSYWLSDVWPIHIVNNAFLHIAENRTDNIAKLKFALPKGHNTELRCFLTHAPIFKMNLDTISDGYRIEKKKFENIGEHKGDSEITSFFDLGIPQFDATTIKPFYIEIIYLKQKVSPTDDIYNSTSSSYNGKYIGSAHSLSNLFCAKPLSYYTKQADGMGLYAAFDGNIGYVDAKENIDSSGNKLNGKVKYKGMYQTGFAIDTNNITFFAIPFSVENIISNQLNVKMVTGATHRLTGFFKSISKNIIGDISVSKKETDAASGSLTLLDIGGKKGRKEAFDGNTILAISFTRSEYAAAIEPMLTNYQNELHPTFLKINTVNFVNKTSKINSSNIYKCSSIDLQLVGYQSGIRNISTLSTAISLHSLNHMVYATSAAAINENVELSEFTAGFNIGHDFSTPAEQDKYFEILEALDFIEKMCKQDETKESESTTDDFIKNCFQEVQAYIYGNGVEENVPEYDSNGDYLESKTKTREYNITLQYGTVSNGDAESDIKFKPNSSTLGDDSTNGLNAISNETEYANNGTGLKGLAIDGNQNPAIILSPEQIEEQFDPIIRVGILNGFEDVPLSQFQLKKTGRGIIDTNITVTFKETKYRGVYGTDYSNEKLSFKNYFKSATGVDEFISPTKRIRQLSHAILHELAHILYAIKKPTEFWAWKMLDSYSRTTFGDPDSENRYDPTDPLRPSHSGGGHLEGQPTGNFSAKVEMYFGNRVANFLWDEASNKFKNEDKGATDYFSNLGKTHRLMRFYFKPLWLEFLPSHNDYTNYQVRNYLKGNLTYDSSKVPIQFN